MSTMNRRPSSEDRVAVTLLTGGGERHYIVGLVRALIARGVAVDIIGSDYLDGPEFHGQPGVNFLNLRGDQRADAGFAVKVSRVLLYYARLMRYAATAKPRIFHILWNNKFEFFDRILLMLYYRLLGKRIFLTAHNVNVRKRDGNDTRLNRLTLRIQYRLTHHIFVHTEKMKLELMEEFAVQGPRITIIPFGMNNAVPNMGLIPAVAKQRLGISAEKRVILFFGRIAPAKGLEYLVEAFRELLARRESYQLIIAGRPDKCERYWAAIRESIREDVQRGRILLRPEFVPDSETEIYFKAADVVVLPYRYIYQSGVLFLGYTFGLPVLAADVGSLKDDIQEGKTGFVFKPEDPADLARTIEKYFASDLYAGLDARRQDIRNYTVQHHSWEAVGQITTRMYGGLPETPETAAAELPRSVR